MGMEIIDFKATKCKHCYTNTDGVVVHGLGETVKQAGDKCRCRLFLQSFRLIDDL